MSTKIYHGYKIHLKNPTLHNLNKFFRPFRHGIRVLAEKAVAERQANLAVEALDCLAVGATPFDSACPWADFYCPASWADSVICQGYQNIYKTRHRDPVYDFDCEISIYPTMDNVFAIINSEREDYIDFFAGLPGVEYYGYWNNTSPEETMNPEAWEKRRSDWDEALKDLFNSGFNFECLGLYGLPHPSRDAVLKAIPSFESRIHGLGREEVLNQKMKELKEADPDKKGFGFVYDAERWVRDNPEGLKAVEDCKNEFAKKLKREIVATDLWQH